MIVKCLLLIIDMITTAFLSQYRLSAKKVEQYLLKQGLKLSSDSTNEYVYYQGETLCIFSRQYATVNPSWINLSQIEQTILHCVYTRHYDGFIRQKHLNMLMLLKTDYPEIAVPFILRSLGEYILEIQLDTTPFIKKYPNIIANFVQQNPVFWQRQKARMASYWNEYYRVYGNWKDYPARQLLLYIDQLSKTSYQK